MDRRNLALNRFLPDLWYSPSDVLLRSSEVFIWDGVRPISPVLDIGCGDGDIGRRIFSFKNKIDIGLDLQPVNVSPLYKKIIQADATKIPYKDESFKTVICNSTIEHINDDVKAISEFARVLKKNGKLFFTAPLPKFKQLIDNRINDRISHLHYRSPNEWEKLLSVKSLSIRGVGFYFPPDSVEIWSKLFKLATTRIYHRELWSYLKDSPYGKLIPSKLSAALIRKFIYPHMSIDFQNNGTWQFITAVKR